MNINKKFILKIEELEFAKFPLDELFSLLVSYNNVKYEFLIKFSSDNKNLICFGSGAYDPKKLSPPFFSRHSWYNDFEESVIYYNDPTLYNDPELRLGWGIGKNDEWYLLIIADIISILARKNDIKAENLLFFGSSGGGFTSVILSTLIKNSSAMVNNPQMFCINYQKEHHFDNIVRVSFDNLDEKRILKKYGHRFDVIQTFEREKYVPPITYLVNVNSKVDLDQLIPFINSLSSLTLFKDNITIYLYQNENGHDGLLDIKETTKLIKNHFKTGYKSKLTHENQELRELYEDKIRSLEKDSINTQKQLKNLANTKPYRIAYFLHRVSHEFLKGDMDNKKDFIKWFYCKLTKKRSNLEFKYNPIMDLIKK